MSKSNNNNEEEIPEKKILHQKRKPEYTLEDILNIYCSTHKIKDNEIQEKIKTIHYIKPSENIETNYDKDKGDVFPLSHHIMPVHSKNELNEDEDKEEENKEKDEKNKEEFEEPKNDEISNCFLCGWEFLKGMSLQEKNTHINLCAEGKGEENKKELISTYTEIENLKKQNGGEESDIHNHNNEPNNEQHENEEKSDKNKNDEEEDEKESEEDKKEGEEDKKKVMENEYVEGNDDDLML